MINFEKLQEIISDKAENVSSKEYEYLLVCRDTLNFLNELGAVNTDFDAKFIDDELNITIKRK